MRTSTLSLLLLLPLLAAVASAWPLADSDLHAPLVRPLSALPPAAAAEASSVHVQEASTSTSDTQIGTAAVVVQTKVYAQLPSSGRPNHIPWAGWFWPSYLDSINVHWVSADTPSPTGKVATAFAARTVANAENRVSAVAGVDAYRLLGKSCRSDADCTDKKCGIRVGATTGVCIEWWHGICHGMTQASICEDEPVSNVVVNGVTFTPTDLKAIYSLAYTGSSLRLIGSQCYTVDANIPRDAYGRVTTTACRDVNPGVMHLVFANQIGIAGGNLGADMNAGYGVSNHAITGYYLELDEIVDNATANTLLHIPDAPAVYSYNTNAVELHHIIMHITAQSYINPGDYQMYPGQFEYDQPVEYILELGAPASGSTAHSDLVVIGGEWAGNTALGVSRPDAIWTSSCLASSGLDSIISYYGVSLRTLHTAFAPAQNATSAAAGGGAQSQKYSKRTADAKLS